MRTTVPTIQPYAQPPPFHIQPLSPQPHIVDAPSISLIFEANDALAARELLGSMVLFSLCGYSIAEWEYQRPPGKWSASS
jgi:hypothetical protein